MISKVSPQRVFAACQPCNAVYDGMTLELMLIQETIDALDIRKTIELVRPTEIFGHVYHNGTLYKAVGWQGDTVICRECSHEEFFIFQTLHESILSTLQRNNKE